MRKARPWIWLVSINHDVAVHPMRRGLLTPILIRDRIPSTSKSQTDPARAKPFGRFAPPSDRFTVEPSGGAGTVFGRYRIRTSDRSRGLRAQRSDQRGTRAPTHTPPGQRLQASCALISSPHATTTSCIWSTTTLLTDDPSAIELVARGRLRQRVPRRIGINHLEVGTLSVGPLCDYGPLSLLPAPSSIGLK